MENTTDKKDYAYGKRSVWQWIVIYAVIGIIIYGLFYYFVLAKKGGYNTSPEQSTAQTTIQPSASSGAAAVSTAAMQITVTGSEFSFTPSAITLKAGQPVELTFKNTGKYPHNFSISDLNVQTKTIQPGGQDTISFTPTQTGSFIYTCTVPGHADRGMKGTLVVQ